MSNCRLAWYHWWTYWNERECKRIKEAIQKAFMQLWSRRVRHCLDHNARENHRYHARTWTELALMIRRNPANVGRYLVETLLMLSYGTALGCEPQQLLPTREEWITRAVSILLAISDEEAAPYVRYILRNPVREDGGDLDRRILTALWPNNSSEMERLIRKVAVALDATLNPLLFGVN